MTGSQQRGSTGADVKIAFYPMLREAALLVSEGRLEQAAAQVMAHLRKQPEEPTGLAQLGEIAMLLGALGQSEQFLRKAISRGAHDFATRRNLASVLNQQERLVEALAIFEALQRESNDPTLSAIQAITLAKLGRNDEALAIQERLVSAHEAMPHHWISYGHSLRAGGRVDGAIAAYRRAVAIDEECGEAWWGLANIKSKVLTDDDVTAMRRAITIAIDVRNSAPLHFALARALHDRSDFAGAFEHYEIGNAQRAKEIGYDPAELSDEITEVEKAVDRKFMAAMEPRLKADLTPIFIVSLPRSGSTLLEQMLGSHPAIEPVGELPYVPAILRTVMERATQRHRTTVMQLIARLTPEQARAHGEDYLRRAAWHRKTDRPFFIDKLPHNWSNILFIRKILPQARFIDIRRNAVDCCFSNFTQSFSSAHASSFSLEHVGRCYADYVRLMQHLDSVAPDLSHHVRYERLIEDPEHALRTVLGSLGLNWDANVLAYQKLNRVVRTPSSEQVRRPLNRDGVNAWSPYAEWLAPLRQTLGVLAEL
jgi:tetratricopeptide (TPR) repeat protein